VWAIEVYLTYFEEEADLVIEIRARVQKKK
jgi:hypothetical protein